MDPLPSMSKSYSLILQIEQRKEGNIYMEMNALNLGQKSDNLTKKLIDKKKLERKNMICEFCNKKRGMERYLFQDSWHPRLV